MKPSKKLQQPGANQGTPHISRIIWLKKLPSSSYIYQVSSACWELVHSCRWFLLLTYLSANSLKDRIIFNTSTSLLLEANNLTEEETGFFGPSSLVFHHGHQTRIYLLLPAGWARFFLCIGLMTQFHMLAILGLWLCMFLWHNSVFQRVILQKVAQPIASLTLFP